ncbi:DUF2867 domain-containing protein [Sodalis sp. RH16]|uniref:DUF2867 domain-containing protein n=1 Tax=Sodalis sp. RH16 TaxID=3394331 RepID=UPI0039B5138F
MNRTSILPGIDGWDLCRVRSVPLPAESGIAPLAAGADLADAFAVAIPPHASLDINQWAGAVLGHPALWVRTLLALRDIAVSGFGLKTSGELRREARAGHESPIDFFPVKSRSPHEIILGADDRHLDFSLSLLIRAAPAHKSGYQLVATSIVHCHNPLGRAYLNVITPFHVLVVKNGLRRSKQWIAPAPSGLSL